MRETKLRKAMIFISHASEDKHLALGLKRLMEAVLHVDVFCTSDIRAMEGGKAWCTQIMNALHRARVCIALLTPISVHRTWVTFESGGAYALGWKHESRLGMLPATAAGLRPGTLRGPFGLIQARDLGSARGIRELCRDAARVLAQQLSPLPSGLISHICSQASKGSPHWSNVAEVLVGERTDESPFDLVSLLADAKTHVFCAGQNLNHIAASPTIRRQITSWLHAGSSRRVELLVCNPAESGAVDTWAAVVGEKYRGDLNRAVQIFKNWKRRLKRAGAANRLDIRVTTLVTTTITVIDPTGERGLMVITPVVFGKPISGERPHFAISRATNRGIFNHYWETYSEVFRRARRLQL